MRLGQIARKYQLTTKEVVKFLDEQGIAVEDNLNTKLSGTQVEIIVGQYATIEEPESVEDKPISEPEVTDKIEVEELQPEQDMVEDTPDLGLELAQTTGEVLASNIESDFVEEKTEEAETPLPEEEIVTQTENLSKEDKRIITVASFRQPEEEEETTPAPAVQGSGIAISESDNVILKDASPEVKAEVIRAEKVTLEGIKVVGKIELPEKPKPVTKEEETKTEDTESTVETPQTTEESTVEEGPYVHPNKRAKIVKPEDEQSTIVKPTKEQTKKKTESTAKNKSKKRENVVDSKTNRPSKKKKKQEAAPIPKKQKKESEDTIKKAKLREKRQKQREREKAEASKPEKSFLKKLWDSMW